jgi:hypothetical protein
MAGGTEETIEADGLERAEDGGDMAVGQRPLDGEDRLILGNDGAALERGPEAFDEFGRPVGEIEERAFLDLAVVAIGFAQQDGGRRVTVRNGFDVQGRIIQEFTINKRGNITIYMAAYCSQNHKLCCKINRLNKIAVGSSG